MKVALTIPDVGAGRWSWQGYVNAFRWFGWEAVNVSRPGFDLHKVNPDLLICSTSLPNQNFIDWRQANPDKCVALNVLAWTDEDLPCINNDGVQATHGNLEFAQAMNPNLVFAQYSEAWRKRLLSKWKEHGFRLGSMEPAADAVVYPYSIELPTRELDIFYVGGRWPYKAQNLDAYVLPLLNEYKDTTRLVGQGWPFPSADMSEDDVGQNLKNAKVALNMHEPHSTIGGFDVVERVFKTLYCGGLCITDKVTEMVDGFRLQDGKHLLWAHNPDEYSEITHEAIEFNEQHDHIREKGQRFVALNHTYFNRVASLLFQLEMFPQYNYAVSKLLTWMNEMGLYE